MPLRVVGDIGGGGALARIEKGRKVMRERKSEWSQTDELPVRSFHPNPILPNDCIPLRLRYLFLLRIDTIQFSRAPFLKNKLQNRTLR